MTVSGWIGVDLDATLAEYHGWKGAGHIGAPVPAMVERVKKWLADGVKVKVFTARVCVTGGYSEVSKQQANIDFADEQTRLIKAWCLEHIGQELEVTCVKDFACIEIWDDRAVQVVPNKGVSVTEGVIADR
jgi:hypothetical protein